MTDERRARLIAAGLSYDDALARMMGNEGLLERVLRKFPSDVSFASLKAALSAGDFKTAGEAAHTLKGVAGNLGFNGLAAAAAELMARLRTGETSGFEEVIPRLDKMYRDAMDALDGM